MKIDIRTIPHALQRYNTVGDYWLDLETTTLVIAVSILPSVEYEYLIALHEQVEAMLCLFAGVSFAEIDRFDLAWEGAGEPGDDPAAPYHHQHQIATQVERMMADALGVDWSEYVAATESVAAQWPGAGG